MSGNLRPAKVPEGQIDNNKPIWKEFLQRLINRKPQLDEIHLIATGIVYFGDDSTDGSWRMMRSGNNFVRQLRVSGTWTTKGIDTP